MSVKLKGKRFSKFNGFYYPFDDFDPNKVIIRANRSWVMVDYPGSISELEMSVMGGTPFYAPNPMEEVVKSKIAARIRKAERELESILKKLDTLKKFEDEIQKSNQQ